MIPRSIELSNCTLRKAKKHTRILFYRAEKVDIPNTKTDIIVVGRVGELGLWYKLSFLSFIGNSLDFRRIKTGKNPYEAIQGKSMVIHGPKMLEPGYEKLSALGISDIVLDRYDIGRAIKKYANLVNRVNKIKRGTDLLFQNRRIVSSITNEITNLYKKGGFEAPFLNEYLIPYVVVVELLDCRGNDDCGNGCRCYGNSCRYCCCCTAPAAAADEPAAPALLEAEPADDDDDELD